jgi:hypothetical protein
MDDEQRGEDTFTDDELSFLRYARFGELPARVLPTEWVEMVESEQPDLPVKKQFDPGPQGPIWG